MNGNGHLRPSKSGRSANEPKTAADVQFKATAHDGAPAVTPERLARDERKESAGQRITNRLSLKPRASLFRGSRESTPEDGANRAASVSTRSARSAGGASSVKDIGTPDRSVSSGVLSGGSSATAFESKAADPQVSASSLETRKVSRALASELLDTMPGTISSELDPARLVQMALSLSESRKSYSTMPSQLRATSASLRSPSTAPQQDSSLPRSSLGDGSARMTTSDGGSSQQGTVPLSASELITSSPQAGNIHFSPATLIRAERARKHFELAAQHRRLLQLLESYSVEPEEGRKNAQYNPLRALRDRTTREGQHEPSLSAESFQDVSEVQTWVDRVCEVSHNRVSQEELSTGKRPSIPPMLNNTKDLASTTSGHKRSGTADTVIQKSIGPWSITPAELILDTYLTARGDQYGLVSQAETGRRSSELAKHDLDQNVDRDDRQHVRRNFLPFKAAERLRNGRRLNRLTRSDSASSASSVEAASHSLFDHSLDKINTAPLRKHMDRLVEAAEREASLQAPVSPDHWSMIKAQQYAARQRAASRASASKPVNLPHDADQHTRHREQSLHETTVSNTASREPPNVISLPQGKDDSPSNNAKPGTVKRITRLARGKSKHDDDTVEQTSREEAQHNGKQEAGIDPTRLSVESARPSFLSRHKTADSTSSLFGVIRSNTKDSDVTEPVSATTRARLGGRFAGKVRAESSKLGDIVLNRDKRIKGNLTDISANASDMSDVDNEKRNSAERTRSSLERTTSRNRFHLPQMPSFRPLNSREPISTLAPILSNEDADHISRQQAARLRDKSPRFQALAPPPINASGHYKRPVDRQRRGSSLDRGSSAEQPDEVDRQDHAIFRKQTSGTSDHQASGRDKQHTVHMRDIGRVRALLIASGIKAQTLAHRLQSTSPHSTIISAAAAEAAQLDMTALTTRSGIEQPPVAVHLLCGYLDNSIHATHEQAQAFQTTKLQALVAKQEMLKTRVKEDLAELVHGASDQADAFNVELSTQSTMLTKQVDDAVDNVLRLRRRQFRLLRRALFKLLEWSVLFLLWFVWFVVVCFKTSRTIVATLFRLVYWLFTF